VNDYSPLRDYLKRRKLPEFTLSFDEIEEIIDAALPRAAHRASWWEDAAQPAGEDAAARGVSRRRLHRDAAGGWEERKVQKDEVNVAATRYAASCAGLTRVSITLRKNFRS